MSTGQTRQFAPDKFAIDHRTRVGRQRRLRTEERIVRAALRVLARKAPENTVIEDFIQEAGIARGTFYNYFRNSDELLQQASQRLIDDMVSDSIEPQLAELNDPAERYSVGLRLFLRQAQADPEWCRLMARLWSFGLIRQPTRDIELGVQLRVFHVPSIAAARDVQMGTLRQALQRFAASEAHAEYVEHIVEVSLRALGVDPAHIASLLRSPLPGLPKKSLSATLVAA